ncbi:1478_t:CDS:2 [Dentiscutata erythropus]|uniref:1478_t:CDS:1 n=1 Tax=Dentiscutata erythropus TaxID=1348616 RepID=A0A9N8YRQ6_9GLOM|nr:1478_t:CDS:2 [Dentiscutata erythropus]
METFHEACRLGILQKTSRRPLEEERQLLSPGSVFVYDENEAGIKRWTDGKLWSPSRIYGDFLLYQELESRLNHIKKYEDLDENIKERIQKENKKFHVSNKGTFVYNNEGLIKKTISANVEGSVQHMIIYEDKQGHHDDLYPPQAYVELSNIMPNPAITKSGALRRVSSPPKVGNSKYSLPKIQVDVRQNHEENQEIRNDNQFKDNQFKSNQFRDNQFKDNQFKEEVEQKIIFALPSNPFNAFQLQPIQNFSGKTDTYSPVVTPISGTPDCEISDPMKITIHSSNNYMINGVFDNGEHPTFRSILPGTMCCHNKPIIMRESLIPPSLPPLPDTINTPQYFEVIGYSRY